MMKGLMIKTSIKKSKRRRWRRKMGEGDKGGGGYRGWKKRLKGWRKIEGVGGGGGR